MDDNAWTADVYRLKEQKAALRAFADAIGAKRRPSGRDEAGNSASTREVGFTCRLLEAAPILKVIRAKCLFFSTGHAPGNGASPGHVAELAPIGWTVTNNCSDEGLLSMTRLPSVAEGEIIRDKLGIFKRVVYSDGLFGRVCGSWKIIDEGSDDDAARGWPVALRGARLARPF